MPFVNPKMSICTISAFFTKFLCKLCIACQLIFGKNPAIIRVKRRKEGMVQWHSKQNASKEDRRKGKRKRFPLHTAVLR